MLILQGLTAFLLVTVHSKEFIAHGKVAFGLNSGAEIGVGRKQKTPAGCWRYGLRDAILPTADCMRLLPLCQGKTLLSKLFRMGLTRLKCPRVEIGRWFREGCWSAVWTALVGCPVVYSWRFRSSIGTRTDRQLPLSMSQGIETSTGAPRFNTMD